MNRRQFIQTTAIALASPAVIAQAAAPPEFTLDMLYKLKKELEAMPEHQFKGYDQGDVSPVTQFLYLDKEGNLRHFRT